MHKPIQREPLLSKLDDAALRPTTFLLAPPGSGKTVLINQWVERRSDAKIIRLSLSARDSDPMVFFRRFLGALKCHAGLVDIATFPVSLQEMDCSVGAIGDALMVALETIEMPVYIILEDFHWIKSTLLHQVVALMIDALPDSIHLIISSRTKPDFSVHQLCSSQRLSVFDAEDFRISHGELSDWLSLSDIDTTPEVLDRILSITEGWPIAIAIALMKVQRSGVDALEGGQGSQPEWVDYIGHVVMAPLSDRAQSLLCDLALLDGFDLPLMNEVLRHVAHQNSESEDVYRSDQAIVMQLVEQGLLVVSSDHGLYRFHRLLKEYLIGQVNLYRTQDERAAIHKVLSNCWLARTKQSESTRTTTNYCFKQAIQHAIDSNDLEFLFSILITAAQYWVKKGELSEAVEALTQLDDEQLVNHPVLFETLLMALTFSRRFNQAHYYLKLIKGRTHTTMVLCLKLTLNVFMNDCDYQSAQRLEALANETDTPADVSAFCGLIVAYYQLQRGELDSAYLASSRAKVELSRLGYEYLGSYVDLIIALCDRYLGRGLSAVRYIYQCYEPLKTTPELPAWVNISTGMIVALYEQNQIEAAEAMCERLLSRVNFSSATEVLTTVYLHLARFRYGAGDQKRSKRLLDQLERILVLGQYRRFKSQVIQENMRQALIESDRSRSDGLFKNQLVDACFETLVKGDYSSVSARNGYSEVEDRYALSLSYYYQIRKQFELAITVLDASAEALERNQINARALVARCNQLVIHYLSGNKELAASKLKVLIQINGWERFSRCVFDESPGLECIFQHAIDLRLIELPSSYQRVFNHFFSGKEEHHESDMISSSTGSLLTNKEQEIYDLLVAGLSNPKISQQLGIALSTTKWHLKNIYAKLGVKNRTSAIVMARKVV